MRSLAFTALSLLITLPAIAQNHRQARVSIDKVYATVRKEGPATSCAEGLPLSTCLYKTSAACQTGFSEALDDCINGDMKHHEDFLLTDDQQKTVTSAMLTCAQSSVIARQKKSDTYKCLSEAKPALEKAPFENRYMIAAASDIEKLKLKIAAFKSGDRSICPGYAGKYASECFKKMLKVSPITSVESAELLFDLGLQAAMKDKAAGFDQRTAALMAVEIGLLVMNHVVPAKFTVSSMKVTSLAEGVSRKILLSKENQSLDAFKVKATAQLETSLAEQPARRPASAPAWQEEREDQLRTRLDKFEARTLVLK